MEPSPDENNFVYLGYYSSADAEKLCAALENAGIGYIADFPDAIDSIAPIKTEFGEAGQVLIRTDPERRDDVNHVHINLFGECMPNYDSSFFAEGESVGHSDADDQASKRQVESSDAVQSPMQLEVDHSQLSQGFKNLSLDKCLSALAEVIAATTQVVTNFMVALTRAAVKPLRFVSSSTYREQVRIAWARDPVRCTLQFGGGVLVLVSFFGLLFFGTFRIMGASIGHHTQRQQLLIRNSNADPQTDRIRQDAQEDSAALVAGDYGRVADFTFPKVVEMAGGRDKLIELLRNSAKEMESRGEALVGAEIIEPKEVITSGSKKFAIVPITLQIKAALGTLRQKEILLAISTDKGKTWTFLDETGTSKEDFGKLLPDSPPQIFLPQKERPRLDEPK